MQHESPRLFKADPLVVIHAVPGCWLEQTQVWLYNQVRYLPPGIESHVVCPTTKNLEQFRLPNIHALDAAGRPVRLWDTGLRKLGARRHFGLLVGRARRYNARILHSHFGSTGWENHKAAQELGLKHVVSFYGLDVNFLPLHGWAARYPKLFDAVDLVLCEGPHMARCIVDLGCPTEKVRVHHLGVCVDEIEFKPRCWEGTEPLRVLLAASFREKKGLPGALEAVGRFQRHTPVEITIIGDAGGSDQAQLEKQRMMDVLEEHDLMSKTRLLGFQTHDVLLAEAYRHHVFFSPSVTASTGDTEGGAPVTLIEMAATGMPIVSTTHCDIPEVILDGQTGLLAPERDVDGLVDRLVYLASHPNSWPEMTKRGREHIEAHFDARRQGERLAHMYETLAGRPHVRGGPAGTTPITVPKARTQAA